MKIEDVKYTFDRYGYGYLEYHLDGQPVKVAAPELKRSILEMGYARLGNEWIGRVPVIKVPATGENSELVLESSVQNPELVSIYLKFLDDLALGLESPSA